MNQQHKDIISTIERYGPISTSEVCEHLSITFGYGGAMTWQDFRNSVSKQLCYLKDKGDITGEDKPQTKGQTKGKPLRFWSLANPQSDCQSADHSEHGLEMASDVAEATIQENLTVAEKNLTVAETVTPEPVSVEVKVEHRPRLSAEQLIQGYKDAGSQGNMLVFAAGVAFAEKYHGISQ